MSAIKVLLKNVDFIKEQALRTGIIKKLAAPLISLLACEPELQYVALRNISFIL
jgi:AP-1 complex subunit beta-1